MPAHDLYRLLGVEANASPNDIKSAFRKLALKFHPDRNTDNPDAIEIFTAIHKAYEILSDPKKRKEYDRTRSAGARIVFPEPPLRTVMDHTKVRLAVDKRVIQLDEYLSAVIRIFENKSQVSLNGLQHFEIAEGPVINSSFPPGRDTPEVEITYLLKPKETGYMEIGPVSYVANGTKYLSDSVHVKVNLPPALVQHRPASRFENFQSGIIMTLIVTYSVLIGYNIWKYDVRPYVSYAELHSMSPSASLLPVRQDVRLETGASPYAYFYGSGLSDEQSLHQIIFHNGKAFDAVVLLTETATHQIIRHHYIRAGDDFVMRHIPDGSYYLKTFFGNDWNLELRILENDLLIGGFNRNHRFAVFQRDSNRILMPQPPDEAPQKHKVYEVTLHPPDNNTPDAFEQEAERFFY